MSTCPLRHVNALGEEVRLLLTQAQRCHCRDHRQTFRIFSHVTVPTARWPTNTCCLQTLQATIADWLTGRCLLAPRLMRGLSTTTNTLQIVDRECCVNGRHHRQLLGHAQGASLPAAAAPSTRRQNMIRPPQAHQEPSLSPPQLHL